MSVLDELRAMEERIAARHKELQPLVDEYQEIERIAAQLGFDLTAPARASRQAPARKRAATRRRGAVKKRAAKRAAKESAAAKPAAATKPAAAKKPAARKAAANARRQPGGTRAAGEQRRAQILQLIEQRPGITVPDISKELGVDPPPLYRVVRKLVSDNVVKKEGKALTLV